MKTSLLPTVNITPQQEKFAIGIVIDELLQVDAYRQAYDNNMTDKQRYEEASKLMKNPKIIQRIAELRSPALAILERNQEKATNKLVEMLEAEEEIKTLDGTIIGTKKRLDINLKAANDILTHIRESKKKGTTINNIILDRGEVQKMIQSLTAIEAEYDVIEAESEELSDDEE